MKKLSSLFVPLLLTILIVACNTARNSVATKEAKRPNIILIMTDDHAKNAMSLYGSELIQTPNMDRIGKEGVIFKNAFVTNSICGPSRATILTGKYNHLNGMYDHSRSFDSLQWTFPKALQANDYYTALIGKWHLKTTPMGFDYWNVLIDQGHYYNPDMIEMGDTSRLIGYTSDLITDIAKRTLSKRPKDKPFCMLYYHKAPHRNWMPEQKHFNLYREDVDLPLPPTFYDDYEGRAAAADQDMEIKDMFLSMDMKLFLPEGEDDPGTGGSGAKSNYDPVQDWAVNYNRLTDIQKKVWDEFYRPITEDFYSQKLEGKELEEWMYQRYMKDYLRCVASVDENIGELLDYLKDIGELDNTLIIYTSDQGFYLGEHGWYDKRYMYEESFGTPLVMRYPKLIKPGTVREELVMNLDLASTILDVAGVPIPNEVQGKSLMPLLENKRTEKWRDGVYYHYYSYPHGWHGVKRHLGIRTDRYKLIHFYNDVDTWELFDLQEDPYEMNNIYNDPKNQELIKTLKEKLRALIIQYKDEESLDLVK